MKNWLLRIFIIVSVSIMGSGAVFAAGRPMTSPEQDAFVAELKKWVDDYALKKYEPLRSGFSPKNLEAEVISDIAGWDGHSGLFGKVKCLSSGEPWEDAGRTGMKTFGEALQMYHDYIAKGSPLCYRGFASYVFQELKNRGIECCYAKISFNSKFSNPAYIDAMLSARGMKKTTENIGIIKKAIKKNQPTEPHDVVIYSTDTGKFVCDFTQAVIMSLRYKYGREKVQEEAKLINCGYTDMMRFARVPLEEYIRFYVDHSSLITKCSPGRSYVGVVDKPFVMLDVDAHPELLTQRACEVYDHFRKLEDYEKIAILGQTSRK